MEWFMIRWWKNVGVLIVGHSAFCKFLFFFPERTTLFSWVLMKKKHLIDGVKIHARKKFTEWRSTKYIQDHLTRKIITTKTSEAWTQMIAFNFLSSSFHHSEWSVHLNSSSPSMTGFSTSPQNVGVVSCPASWLRQVIAASDGYTFDAQTGRQVYSWTRCNSVLQWERSSLWKAGIIRAVAPHSTNNEWKLLTLSFYSKALTLTGSFRVTTVTRRGNVFPLIRNLQFFLLWLEPATLAQPCLDELISSMLTHILVCKWLLVSKHFGIGAVSPQLTPVPAMVAV